MNTPQEIDYGVITFEEGIPGFSDLRSFQLVQAEPDSPVFSLLSLENDKIGFWLINPFAFFREYEFTLKEHHKETLQIKEDTPVAVFNIATLRGQNAVTVNLKAPIVINMQQQKAKQIILEDDRYDVRQPLLVSTSNEPDK